MTQNSFHLECRSTWSINVNTFSLFSWHTYWSKGKKDSSWHCSIICKKITLDDWKKKKQISRNFLLIELDRMQWFLLRMHCSIIITTSKRKLQSQGKNNTRQKFKLIYISCQFNHINIEIIHTWRFHYSLVHSQHQFFFLSLCVMSGWKRWTFTHFIQ